MLLLVESSAVFRSPLSSALGPACRGAGHAYEGAGTDCTHCVGPTLYEWVLCWSCASLAKLAARTRLRIDPPTTGRPKYLEP